MSTAFELQLRELNSDREKKMVSDFLLEQGLKLDDDVEYTAGIFKDREMIATGSLSGNVLKSLAVKKTYQGEGITNKIVTQLINEAYERGETHLFIYTKPKNSHLFQDLGFYVIAEVKNHVCLLENKRDGIKTFVKNLETKKVDGKIIGSIVMNCNPFTLGHQYLIEKAAGECDVLHIFIVWEDRSSFPAATRYELVKAGTEHLENVILHKGENYVISSATFPGYFLKGEEEILRSQTMLDLKIFTEYIVPALNIHRRYVGEEPYCPVTKIYNESMQELLPEAGLILKVIERKKINDSFISASMVRKGLAEGGPEKIRHLVPESTYQFLLTDEGKKIIEEIKVRSSRH